MTSRRTKQADRQGVVGAGFIDGGFLMKRIGGLTLAIALSMPAAAHAQKKPSNSMATRSAELYLEQAKKASSTDKKTELLDKVLEVLAPGMETDADNPRVWLLAGQAYARKGDFAGADSAFDRAETLYPDYAEEIDPERLDLWIRRYNAGVAAIQANSHDDAIRHFEDANRVYDKRPDAFLSVASLYARKGDLAAAEKAYRSALDVIRGPASKSLGPDVAKEWRESEDLASTQLAQILADQGGYDEAAKIYRALIEKQPDNAQARSNLAVVLSKGGHPEEASKIYAELLARPDLNETALFNIGVGLYRAEQYEGASQAFRKVVAANPTSHDGLYNYGQAIYARIGELDRARAAATGTDADRLTTQVIGANRELLEVAGKLREIDPNNRIAAMMLAQAQRSMGELEKDPAAAEEWKKKVLATLEQAENMPFGISDTRIETLDGTVRLTGSLTNAKLPAGQQVTIEFTFLDATGAAVATQSVTVAAPAPESAVDFTVEAKTDRTVTRWKYHALN
jgi:tetratricopeptide (TPR) repeat protein